MVGFGVNHPVKFEGNVKADLGPKVNIIYIVNSVQNEVANLKTLNFVLCELVLRLHKTRNSQ